MQSFLDKHELILMEAAIVEPIRRGGIAPLDPLLQHGGLIYDPKGRSELRKLYLDYANIAIDAELPFLMCTPTWRTNSERVQHADADPNINRDAVHFLVDIRDELESPNVKVGGLIGCKNDCYQPGESLSAAEGEEFHAWQIDQLSNAGVDFLMAATIPSVAEATGIAAAMAKTGTPYIISFVIDRFGLALDGTSLLDSIISIDSAVQEIPIGYMINCAYPTFLCADQQPRELFSRLIGFQGNASSLDHFDLDGSEDLQINEVTEWGEEMLSLLRHQGMKILGGCCGTNAKHLEYIVKNNPFLPHLKINAPKNQRT